MSLIVGILQNDFIMFCSDSRLNGYDQKKYLVQKIFKLNDNLMYATGGDKESIDNILDKAISVCEENVSYREFSNIIDTIKTYFPFGKEMTITEIKDAVKKVLDLGCMIDDEIDNEMQYEYIKKGVT